MRRKGGFARNTASPSLLIASHAAVYRNKHGALLTKNRVADIVNGLSRCGWSVTVLAPSAPEQLPFLTTPLDDNVGYRRLGFSLRSVVGAAALIRTADTGLSFLPTVRTALVAIALGRRGVLYAGHSWALMPGSPRWRFRLEALAARRAEHVIAAGDAVRERFVTVAPDAATCVPLVDNEVVALLRANLDEPKDRSRLKLLFVGSIEERKGVRELIQALRLVPQVSIRVVGNEADRELASELRSVVEGRSDSSMEPYLDWPELRERYRWANALVLPAHHEGFPRVIYEASAFGAAIVATPVGGIPTRLVDRRDALLVPVGDVPALTAALADLADGPRRSEELARHCRAALAPVFSDPDPVAQFDRSLRAIAARSRAAARPSKAQAERAA